MKDDTDLVSEPTLPLVLVIREHKDLQGKTIHKVGEVLEVTQEHLIYLYKKGWAVKATKEDYIKYQKKKVKQVFETALDHKNLKDMQNSSTKPSRKKDDEVQISLLITKEIFVEQIYDTKNKLSSFCIFTFKNNKISVVKEIDYGGVKYIPIAGEEIEKKAILLPSMAEDYGTDEELDQQIKDFITKWLDVPHDVLQFAVWNIKRSWVYERFHTLNYLRALGDTGQGKSRFLDTLGHIHYKPIATSGASTAAPIFRIINKWHGTLIMDEADFKNSDESQDIIKIINQGYEKGRFVMRCDKEEHNKVKFFDPFCPKILATRRTFQDKAVESRCITQVMIGTSRRDIKWNLNDDFWNEAEEIRNKLLMWRFKNFNIINPNNNIDLGLGELEPRVQQIVGSFVSLFGANEKQLDVFRVFIKDYQENLIEERKNSFDGSIVSGIWKLLDKKEVDISAQDIIEIENITNKTGHLVKPRGLSSSLKSLGFGKGVAKRVGEKTKKCIPLNPSHLTDLFKRYGYCVTVVTIVMDQAGNIKKAETGLSGVHRNNGNNGNKVTESLVQIEELITPFLAKCKVCGVNPSHFSLKGDYFCSKDCANSYKVNK